MPVFEVNLLQLYILSVALLVFFVVGLFKAMAQSRSVGFVEIVICFLWPIVIPSLILFSGWWDAMNTRAEFIKRQKRIDALKELHRNDND